MADSLFNKYFLLKEKKTRSDCRALSSDFVTRSKKYSLSSATGAGRFPGWETTPRCPLTCIAAQGPSIGRAGRPHQPRSSPHWHLSREGVGSQHPTPQPSVSQTAAHPPAPTPHITPCRGSQGREQAAGSRRRCQGGLGHLLAIFFPP